MTDRLTPAAPVRADRFAAPGGAGPSPSSSPGCRRAAGLAVAATLMMAAGCATTGARSERDPWEPFNRSVYAFNEGVDKYALRPTAQAYVKVVPEVFRNAFGNFFSNIGDLWIAANQLMQGKPVLAVQDLFRFTLNSTLGFFGVADVATAIGYEKHNEDFGQTLGKWGVPTGPYLVLPLFGPSNLRDGPGLGVDLWASPTSEIITNVPVRNSTYGIRLVDTRASLLSQDGTLSAIALDKYSFLRDGYLARRRSLVWDGNPPEPPPERDDDADDKPKAK